MLSVTDWGGENQSSSKKTFHCFQWMVVDFHGQERTVESGILFQVLLQFPGQLFPFDDSVDIPYE